MMVLLLIKLLYVSLPATVQGNLTVHGEVSAKKLHVDEVTADIRNERTTS